MCVFWSKMGKGHAWVMSSWSITQPQTRLQKHFSYTLSLSLTLSLSVSVVSPLVKALWEHSKWGKHYKCAVNFNGVHSASVGPAHRKDTFRIRTLNSCKNKCIMFCWHCIYVHIYLQSLPDKFTYTQIENKQKLLKQIHKYSFRFCISFFNSCVKSAICLSH